MRACLSLLVCLVAPLLVVSAHDIATTSSDGAVTDDMKQEGQRQLITFDVLELLKRKEHDETTDSNIVRQAEDSMDSFMEHSSVDEENSSSDIAAGFSADEMFGEHTNSGDETMPGIPAEMSSEDENMPSIPADRPSNTGPGGSPSVDAPNMAPSTPDGGAPSVALPSIGTPTTDGDDTSSPTTASFTFVPTTEGDDTNVPTESGFTFVPTTDIDGTDSPTLSGSGFSFVPTLDGSFGPTRPLTRSCTSEFDCVGIFGTEGSRVCYSLSTERSLNACIPNRFVEEALIASEGQNSCGVCEDKNPVPTSPPTMIKDICNPMVECDARNNSTKLFFCVSIRDTLTTACVAQDKIGRLVDAEAGFCGICPSTDAPSDGPLPTIPSPPTVEFTSSPTIDGGGLGSPTTAPGEGGPTAAPVSPEEGSPSAGPGAESPTVSPGGGPVDEPTVSPVEGEPTKPPTSESGTVAPTEDPLRDCSPVVSCDTPLSDNEGVLVCLEITGVQIETCLLPPFVPTALDNGFCGSCPTDPPTNEPTAAPSTGLPTLVPSEAPTGIDDLCDPNPAIPCGDDSIFFCLTDLEGLGGDRTICLPKSLYTQVQNVGYCGECPEELPSLFPTPDPFEGCDPIDPCEGFLGSTYEGVEFCIQDFEEGTQADVCVPYRFIQEALNHGSCGNCTSPTLPPGATSAPTTFPIECLDIPECSEGNIKYCLKLESGGNFEACLPLSGAPIIVPQLGTCGECEDKTTSPTEVGPAGPTSSPSRDISLPTLSPTGALDGCEVEPPVCEFDTGNNSTGSDGVVFCYFLEGGGQVEFCMYAEDVQDLLDRGYCGPCIQPPSPTPSGIPTAGPTVTPGNPSAAPITVAPTTAGQTRFPSTSPATSAPSTAEPTVNPGNPSALPTTAAPALAAPTRTPTAAPTKATSTAVPSFESSTESPTMQPSLLPTGLFPSTLQPTASPSLAPTTNSPTINPTEDILAGCDPVIECSENSVLFCLEVGEEPTYFEICLPIDLVQDALDQGVCGECPTSAPTSFPSIPTSTPPSTPTALPTLSPTIAPSVPPTNSPSTAPISATPTVSPTGALDGCGVEPPICVIPGEEESEGVTFCIVVGSIQFELCVPVDRVQDLLDQGYCGPCIAPPSKAPTAAPSRVSPSSTPTTTGFPTMQPSLLPTGILPSTLQPTASPSLAPTTNSPTINPTEDILAGCDPVIECSENSVLFCLEVGEEPTYFEICLPIDLVQDALLLGVCGECPTLAPTSFPSALPTNEPTLSPTTFTENCDEEPPICELFPGDLVSRVIFCVQLGGQQAELCVAVENLPLLLEYGECGPCPTIAPSTSPTLLPTGVPSQSPTGVTTPPTRAPVTNTTSPSSAPTTLSPTNSPTDDPLLGCDPVVPCGVEDNGVVFCLLGPFERSVEICLPVGLIQEALERGICGNCPTSSPSSTPTALPTLAPTIAPSVPPTNSPSTAPTSATPTVSPTGALDGCGVEPPICVIPGEEESEGVTFCIVVGSIQFELCVPVDRVQDLLDQGYCGPCIAPPSKAPTATPSTALPSSMPSEVETTAPSWKPSSLPSRTQPTTSIPSSAPTEAPTTGFPSVSPTVDPLSGCDPVIRCPGGVVFCLQGKSEDANNEICLPVEYVQEALGGEHGFCGECPSLSPSGSPTVTPTSKPTVVPTNFPSVTPTGVPTPKPSVVPTNLPSAIPSEVPTPKPTGEPTLSPSTPPTIDPLTGCDPVVECVPDGEQYEDGVIFCLETRGLEVCLPIEFVQQGLEEGFCGGCPTESPSASPTRLPSPAPTPIPSTQTPSSGPTEAPSTLRPTIDTSTPSPTSPAPTLNPTAQPSSMPTLFPTLVPSPFPTTSRPTVDPLAGCGDAAIIECSDDEVEAGIIFCYEPSLGIDFEDICVPPYIVPFLLKLLLGECGPCPTFAPTPSPTPRPTPKPTPKPTANPTASPTQKPTAAPTPCPTPAPTGAPTDTPTIEPTGTPTEGPTTAAPTLMPITKSPTAVPTTSRPTSTPTKATKEPSAQPTRPPNTGFPSMPPAPAPSKAPTVLPTSAPTLAPSVSPTTEIPSESPTTETPTGEPTNEPSLNPTTEPPTDFPSPAPTEDPLTGCSPVLTCSGDYGDGIVMCIYLSEFDSYEECVPVEFVQDVFGKNPKNICGECPFVPTEFPTFSPTDEPTDEPTPEPTNEPTFNPTYGFQCEGDEFACSNDGHVFLCHEGETLCVSQEDAIYLIIGGAECGQCPTFYCDSNHFPCGNGKVLICHIQGKDPNELCISPSALSSHEGNHCDYCGPCVSNEIPPACL